MPRASSRTTTASRRASTASSSGATPIGGPVYIPKLFNTREDEALLLLVAGVHQAEAGHAERLRQYADRGAAGGRFLRLHRRQRRAVCAHRPHHREPGSEQQYRGPGRVESGRRQGRPGDPERPAPAEYLRPLRRFRHRLHPGRPIRHPAIPAQLLLELQRDASAPQRYPPRGLQPDLEAEQLGALHQRLRSGHHRQLSN